MISLVVDDKYFYYIEVRYSLSYESTLPTNIALYNIGVIRNLVRFQHGCHIILLDPEINGKQL
jgi:hypothetical protein